MLTRAFSPQGKKIVVVQYIYIYIYIYDKKELQNLCRIDNILTQLLLLALYLALNMCFFPSNFSRQGFLINVPFRSILL